MYCSNCGKEIADDAKFCKYCGYDLSHDESVSACNEETENTENIATASDNTPIDEQCNENKCTDVISNDIVPNKNANEIKPKKISRSQRIRKQREIEDARAIEMYTVTDERVSEADVLPKERIVFTDKGTLRALKTKEIVYIVLCGLLMIGTAIALYFIRNTTKPDEESMSGLVVLGYFLFFIIFFALAVGVDRVYNLMTLGELAVRHITLKKYGFRMDPLTLRDGRVYSLSISGECEQCNPEMRGTYNIEWQNDSLIAVCSFDRRHLYRIDMRDVLGEETQSAVHTEENSAQ